MDWAQFAVAGFAGFGIGLGVVIGAFVARTMRRYMEGERMKPYYRRHADEDDQDS